MDVSAMYTFLTEENVFLHLDYYRTIRAKLSIFLKSMKQPEDLTVESIFDFKLNTSFKKEILPLIKSAELHKIYFNSFSFPIVECEKIKKYFSSKEAFLFDLYCAAKEKKLGFLCVFKAHSKGIDVAFSDDISISQIGDISLAVDLSEHAYFLDYGFDRDAYLKSALGHLNISKLFDG